MKIVLFAICFCFVLFGFVLVLVSAYFLCFWFLFFFHLVLLFFFCIRICCIHVKHFTIVMHNLSWLSFPFSALLCFLFYLLSCLCILRLLSDNFILLCCTNISNENQHRWRWRRCTFPFNNIIYIAYNYCCNYNCLEYI